MTQSFFRRAFFIVFFMKSNLQKLSTYIHVIRMILFVTVGILVASAPVNAAVPRPDDQVVVWAHSYGFDIDTFNDLEPEEIRLIVQAQKVERYLSETYPRGILKDYAYELVVAADSNDLPPELIAAIGVIESGACDPGKTFRDWNCFGWGSRHFEDVVEAIDTIAWNLGGNNPKTASYYDGKSIKEKMYSYNSENTSYWRKLTHVRDGIKQTNPFISES